MKFETWYDAAKQQRLVVLTIPDTDMMYAITRMPQMDEAKTIPEALHFIYLIAASLEEAAREKE